MKKSRTSTGATLAAGVWIAAVLSAAQPASPPGYHALGIAPDTSCLVERRPVCVTSDGKGQPILDLFA